MSDQQKISQRDDKYWIKPGVEVAHREFPDRKMIVDDVLKKTESIVQEDKKAINKTFVIGVECHWFDKDGRYDRGRFLTMELIKFGEKRKSIDPDSFPKEIPTSALSEDVL